MFTRHLPQGSYVFYYPPEQNSVSQWSRRIVNYNGKFTSTLDLQKFTEFITVPKDTILEITHQTSMLFFDLTAIDCHSLPEYYCYCKMAIKIAKWWRYYFLVKFFKDHTKFPIEVIKLIISRFIL